MLCPGSGCEHIAEQRCPRDVDQHSRRCCSNYHGKIRYPSSKTTQCVRSYCAIGNSAAIEPGSGHPCPWREAGARNWPVDTYHGFLQDFFPPICSTVWLCDLMRETFSWCRAFLLSAKGFCENRSRRTRDVLLWGSFGSVLYFCWHVSRRNNSRTC